MIAFADMAGTGAGGPGVNVGVASASHMQELWLQVWSGGQSASLQTGAAVQTPAGSEQAQPLPEAKHTPVTPQGTFGQDVQNCPGTPPGVLVGVTVGVTVGVGDGPSQRQELWLHV
jgi:hypothetical protein